MRGKKLSTIEELETEGRRLVRQTKLYQKLTVIISLLAIVFSVIALVKS